MDFSVKIASKQAWTLNVYIEPSEMWMKMWISIVKMWISGKRGCFYPQSIFLIPLISARVCTLDEAK